MVADGTVGPVRELGNRLLLLALVGTALASVPAPRAESAAAAPSHSISVSGTGVVTYPDFDESIERYGITTTAATAGTVTVQVATSGTVTVNGRPAPGGTRTVGGLEPGDEIAVFIADGSGTARYSYVYLPAGFPLLERMPAESSAGPLAPGLVLLTLGKWTSPSPFFETAVDANGVPAFVRQQNHAMDFQRQPNGSYTVFHQPTPSVPSGQFLVELDSRFEQVATHRTQAPLVNTDGHDAIIEEDGSVWLMAYEPSDETDPTAPIDAEIQRIEPDGTVSFSWSSNTLPLSESMTTHPDYAHVNSFQVMKDGDLLVSFRHLSSVFKIATSARGDIDQGEIIWKLGGRDSNFDFPVGDGGPCAQHTAHELENGNILMFDNGSLPPPTSPPPTGPPPLNAPPAFCVDPADPAGDAVGRTQTRVVEWELNQPDGGTWTAEPVWEYDPPLQFAIFAGSSQRMANGNTVIGWAAETDAVATEVDSDKRLVWGIRDPQSGSRYFTYRAHKAAVPDATPPRVSTTLADGSTYVEGSTVAFDYQCTDRGGSSLVGCSGPVASGGALDTSRPGAHTVVATATDGAGNRTTVTRTYTVLAASRPDAMIRLKGSPAFRGDDTYGRPPSQRVRARLPLNGRATVQVRLENDGARAMALAFKVRGESSSFRVRGRHADGGKSPRLQPGESWTFRLRVVRLDDASPGDRLVLKVPVRSSVSPVRRDGVSLLVRARG